MSFNIIPTIAFERELKRLLKKYKSLKSDITNLLSLLNNNPIVERLIGNNCFKIRLAISSKAKGKSGGAKNHHLRKDYRKRNVFIINLR